ncbi:MAG TPA: peptidoglycan-binding domain-containing protein, partial [Nannocystis sp.]
MNATREQTNTELAPGARGAAVVALQRVLDVLGELTGEIDGHLSAATTAAVQGLQRRFGDEPTGELTPALVARAREAAARVGAEAWARAAAAAEESAALYQQIAALRQEEIAAARARHPGRAVCLSEEEVGASLLAAARSDFEAAGHWRRAAAHDDP